MRDFSSSYNVNPDIIHIAQIVKPANGRNTKGNGRVKHTTRYWPNRESPRCNSTTKSVRATHTASPLFPLQQKPPQHQKNQPTNQPNKETKPATAALSSSVGELRARAGVLVCVSDYLTLTRDTKNDSGKDGTAQRPCMDSRYMNSRGLYKPIASPKKLLLS